MYQILIFSFFVLGFVAFRTAFSNLYDTVLFNQGVLKTATLFPDRFVQKVNIGQDAGSRKPSSFSPRWLEAWMKYSLQIYNMAADSTTLIMP